MRTKKKKSAVWGWNIHPGEILREEFLKPQGITVYELAKRVHLTRSRVNDIVRGRRTVTADTALRLAKFFGTTPAFWMNLQTTYELREAANSSASEIEAIEHIPQPAGSRHPLGRSTPND